jgi:hypothetical protein
LQQPKNSDPLRKIKPKFSNLKSCPLVIALAFLLVAEPSVASPALTIRDYQDLELKGTQGEQTISTYLMATIDAIGMTNEFIVGRKDQPICCQGDRTISAGPRAGYRRDWLIVWPLEGARAHGGLTELGNVDLPTRRYALSGGPFQLLDVRKNYALSRQHSADPPQL